MVKLIGGGAGSGKTKTIIELVNAAVKDEKGSVVCITKGDKLRFDISRDARLVNISEYAVSSYDGLLGFLCGIHAGNYDITHIYIDGLYKVAGVKDPSQAESFLDKLNAFADTHTVKFTVSLSEDDAAVTEGMKKYA